MAIQRPKLKFQRGTTYIIDQSDSSNAGHPLRFTADSGATEYTTGVTVTGTPGQAGAKTTFVVPNNAPTNLMYYCSNHGIGMGNKMKTQYESSTLGAVSNESTPYFMSLAIPNSTPATRTSWTNNIQRARHIEFNYDGTSMWCEYNKKQYIWKYNLSTAYDISTATIERTWYSSASTNWGANGTGHGFAFNKDGSKIWGAARNVSNNTYYLVDGYTLSSNYNFGTGTSMATLQADMNNPNYSPRSNLRSLIQAATGVDLPDAATNGLQDGMKFCDDFNRAIWWHGASVLITNLSTPPNNDLGSNTPAWHDLAVEGASAVDNDTWIGTHIGGATMSWQGWAINPSGTALYGVGKTNSTTPKMNYITECKMTTPFDLSTLDTSNPIIRSWESQDDNGTVLTEFTGHPIIRDDKIIVGVEVSTAGGMDQYQLASWSLK